MAVSCDGSNNCFLRVTGTLPDLSFPFSWSCWIKDNDIATWKYVFQYADTDIASRYYGLIKDTARYRLTFRTSAGTTNIETTFQPTEGAWHHLVGVHSSGSEHFLYIDGTLEGSSSELSGSLTDINSFTIGSEQNGYDEAEAEFAEMIWYSEALTENEVNALAAGANAFSMRNFPDGEALGYWPLWNVDMLTDLSGNGLVLTNNANKAITSYHPNIIPFSRMFAAPGHLAIAAVAEIPVESWHFKYPQPRVRRTEFIPI